MSNSIRLQVCAVLVAVSFTPARAGGPNAQNEEDKTAATAREAVEAVIAAVQRPARQSPQNADLEAVLGDLQTTFKALRPHLSASSQNAIDAVSRFCAEAKVHDRAARKHFGKRRLDRVQDYMPAATVALRLTTTSTLLSQPPAVAPKIASSTKKSGAEVIVELQWRVGEGTSSAMMEETLVAVQETKGWKVLLPTRRVPFGIDLLGDQKKQEPREDWDAEKVRKSNDEMVRTVEAMTARLQKLTREVEADTFASTEGYLRAVYAMAAASK